MWQYRTVKSPSVVRLVPAGGGWKFTETTLRRPGHSIPNEILSLFFPLTMQLGSGEYMLMYWQNGERQKQLMFSVKTDEENVVTVK